MFGNIKKIFKRKKVVNKQHYYQTDIWGIVKDELKDIIPKGFTLYGEILGYTPSGEQIQKGYDYGCTSVPKSSAEIPALYWQHKTYIYRITFTNEDGFVIELNDLQIKEFCDKYGLNYTDTFYFYGKVRELVEPLYHGEIDGYWKELLIKELEEKYNEKDCYMCKNCVPEEGIILRVNKTFAYEAYKLKSFRFLEGETKQLDTEQSNIEDEN